MHLFQNHIHFFFGSVVNIKLVRDFVILIFTVSLLFLFYTNNNSVYFLFRLWLVVLLHELHAHDYVQKEKNKRPMISLCRSAFWLLLLLSLFLFYFFIFFFTFKSLRDQYNHNVERTVDSFQNKIFVHDDIQKSYFKIKLRKRNKSPTYTFLQVNLNSAHSMPEGILPRR